MRQIKLGTRRSLLAMAQSLQVAQSIEAANKHLQVELVGIETQGDRIQDVPLNQIDGKDFFVKEIDHALLAKEVDLTVHSLKDLSLERPAGIARAATPQRLNPRDIVIFAGDIEASLAAGRAIKIGTSSPRRLETIPAFLERALPQVGDSGQPQLSFVPIRGNVNTRLGRLKAADPGERLDGVVLAIAGLNRLYKDSKARVVLADLLSDTKFMVLPLTECPTAPGQGALAIECRSDDPETLTACQAIHCDASQAAVSEERRLMAGLGGGCHQRYGITVREKNHLGRVTFAKGLDMQGQAIDRIDWQMAHELRAGKVWDGSSVRGAYQPMSLTSLPGLSDATVFAASSRALGELPAQPLRRLFVSGVKSWQALAKKGYWVHACGEGFGYAGLLEAMAFDFYEPTPASDWVVLTHKDAVPTWEQAKVFATYERDFQLSTEEEARLKTADVVFWSSASQFQSAKHLVKADAQHVCGAGKTALALSEAGVANVVVFPSIEAWRKREQG